MPTFISYTVFNRMKLQDILQSQVFDVCTPMARCTLLLSLYSLVVLVIISIYGPSDEDKPMLNDFIDVPFCGIEMRARPTWIYIHIRVFAMMTMRELI
ncbi:hypothetical protein TWF718_008351 [Orbilia javanica]|uniref:Uncharacterized protein n=1 Tax=Orbilia javanica TaxID=47235 RepID=A0AAN8RH96_9PEZI